MSRQTVMNTGSIVKTLMLIAVLFSITSITRAEWTDPASEREMYVYSRGISEIREIREVEVNKGENELLLYMFPQGTYAETITLDVRDPKTVSTVSYGFITELLEMDKYWFHMVGREVELNDSLYVGTLRRVTDNKLFIEPFDKPGVLQVVDRSDVEDLQISELPDGLVTEPALRWSYRAKKSGTVQIELRYFCEDFKWDAEYQATLDKKGVNLKGWFVIDNFSRFNYHFDRLTLVAGSIHLAGDKRRVDRENPRPGAASGGSESSFGEVRRFVVDGPGILYPAHTTILPMFSTDHIDNLVQYIYDAAIFDDRVTAHLLFALAGKDARPLPAGTVKVYRKEKSDTIFIGEDTIDDTPPGSQVDITLSQAFDITAERTRKAETEVKSGGTAETFEIKLANSMAKPVAVIVYERLFGDWRIPDARLDGVSVNVLKEDARTARFDVSLDSGVVRTLTYRVEYRR